MMKFSAIITAISASVAPLVANAQPVAKFSAGWRDGDNELARVALGTPTSAGAFKEKLSTIKSANNKELLIGLSGVINLITFTQAKGKNSDGEVTSTADATVSGKVVLVPTDSLLDDPCGAKETTPDGAILAAPGVVPFSARKQTLTVDVDLIAEIEDDEELEVMISGYVEVGLEIDTTASHHFNFVAWDLPSDRYDVYACWYGDAGGSVSLDDEGNYEAVAGIKKRMLTVQQLRAVKTTDEDIDVGNGNLFRRN